MSEHVYGLDHIQIAMPKDGEPLARQFYGELLGLAEIPKPPNLAKRGGVWFRCGSLQIHLGTETEFLPAKKAHLAFLVRDLSQLLDVLRSSGCEIKFDPEPNPGYDRAFTADPFGNRIELVQPEG